jgi:peroxiredoxin
MKRTALILTALVLPLAAWTQNADDPGARVKMMIDRLDTDKDGILTKAEYRGPQQRWKRMDRNRDGKVDAKEIEAVVKMMEQQRGGRQPDAQGKQARTNATVQKLFGADESLPVGDAAPNFTLKRLNSDETVTLSDLYADKPVVLTLGSYTCPPFRRALEGMEDVYQSFGKDCNFVFVYILEAHASDGKVSRANEAQNIEILQHNSYEMRSEAATTCQGKLEITMPIVVDTLDNATEKAYGGAPNRSYLIDKGGKIIYKGPRGPQGTQPTAVTAAIRKLLGK